ncbi:MAG: SpoIIE family protein phosphatase [Rhodopirellula sp.]|nr:SpoIIE family protein phosphatase [Rhodopirellula sp.]
MPSIEINLGVKGARTFPLKSHETIVGRNHYCDLLLDSHGVSRRHSRIFCRGDNYYVEDLNSINGTFLNRERVHGPTLLRDGDTIHFYRVSGVFRLEAMSPPNHDGDNSDEGFDQQVPIESLTPANVVRTSTTAVPTGSGLSGAVEQRLQAVLKVVGSLGRSLDLAGVLANILDGLFDVFPQSRRGNIWLIDDETEVPVLRATKQTGSQTLCSDSLGPLKMSITDDVIAQRHAILSIDEIDEGQSESIFDFRLRSSICAPLTGPYDEILGAICIDSDDGDRPFTESDLDVLTSVSAVAGQATEYARQHERLVENAIKYAIEKERRRRAEEKLSVAESVQQSLYPKGHPAVAGFDIAGAAFPTEEGCGDYFDFIPLSDGRLAIVVGDVSGHGLGAALYMVQTRSYIRAYMAQELGVEQVLTRVNQHLCADLKSGTFVTLFLGILDPISRELIWSSAGHPGVRLSGDGRCDEIKATNLVLGLLDNVVYESASIQLCEGDVVVLPTDGIIEAMSMEQTIFGQQRMLKCVQDARQLSSEEIIVALSEACREFAGEKPIHDDMTCVLIKVE